ncbi:hypothetical protein [Vibrio harveyi]|uniref:hypothetical protein n=1 Tax=Vibrio harveyi TaxID=669 RepID=UPI0005EFC737|nr:hypothetical protein [Vibrio harveyi]
MGTVRENMPNGSPRNKIEYLADCIDDAKANAGNGGAVTVRPANLLKNAAFLGVHDQSMGNRWASNMGYRQAGSMNAYTSTGMPAAPFWGVECITNSNKMPVWGTYEVSNDAQLDPDDVDFTELMGGFAAAWGNGAKQVVFQVFDPQRPYLINHSGLEGNDYRCYLRFISGGANDQIRFGVVALNRNGKTTSIIASKTIQETEVLKHREEWLSIPRHSMNPAVDGQRYAFFVERLEHTDNGYTVLTGAGVYWGKEGERPELANTEQSDQGGFYTLPVNVPASGDFSFDLPSFPMRYEPEQHLIFAITDADSRRAVLESRPCSFAVSGNTVTVSGASGNFTAPCKLEVYYSQCANIGFYQMV